MTTRHERAVADLVEEFEIKATRLRLSAKKYDRDLAILEAFLARKTGSGLVPHIRAHITRRLQARTDAQNAVQEMLQSQDFYRSGHRG